jgi:hypothetical protein
MDRDEGASGHGPLNEPGQHAAWTYFDEYARAGLVHRDDLVREANRPDEVLDKLASNTFGIACMQCRRGIRKDRRP